MLLPRFSLRTTLWGITACAGFFLVLGQAVSGSKWAIVVSATLISLFVLLLFHGLLFVLVSGLAALVGKTPLPARTSRGGVQFSSDEQVPPTLNSTPSNS